MALQSALWASLKAGLQTTCHAHECPASLTKPRSVPEAAPQSRIPPLDDEILANAMIGKGRRCARQFQATTYRQQNDQTLQQFCQMGPVYIGDLNVHHPHPDQRSPQSGASQRFELPDVRGRWQSCDQALIIDRQACAPRSIAEFRSQRFLAMPSPVTSAKARFADVFKNPIFAGQLRCDRSSPPRLLRSSRLPHIQWHHPKHHGRYLRGRIAVPWLRQCHPPLP